jgi:hypothetical protein
VLFLTILILKVLNFLFPLKILSEISGCIKFLSFNREPKYVKLQTSPKEKLLMCKGIFLQCVLLMCMHLVISLFV